MNEFNNAIDLVLGGRELTDELKCDLEDDKYLYVKWLTKLNKAPQIIKDARGIGAWDNPEVVIVVPEIQSHIKTEYGHAYWWELGSYRRLRPLMESRKSLRFLSVLFTFVKRPNPWEWCYITPFKKSWAQDVHTSNDIFRSEIASLKPVPKLILELGTSVPRNTWHTVS